MASKDRLLFEGGWKGLSGSFFLLIFLLLWGCGGEKSSDSSDGQKASKGTESSVPARYHRDSLQARLEGLNDRIKDDPQNGELYYERAKVKERLGRMDAALDDMDRALRIDSTRSDFHHRKGELHFRNENVKQALKHYRKAVALDGKNTDALIGMSELFLATRDHQKAIDYANEALKVDQHLPRPYTIKGLVHQRTGDSSKAISSLQTSVEMEPDNYAAYLQLGFLMADQDRDIAIDYYDRASKLQPEDPRPLYNKAFYLKEHGRPDEAIDTYKELIHVDTGYVDAYYDIGYIHLVQMGDYRKGIEWFNKALSLVPEYHQAIYNRGLCYEKLGKRDSAIRDYREALRIKSDFRKAAKGLQRLEAEYQGDR
jgi:tetratricopeptide (TPR) repeat protein